MQWRHPFSSLGSRLSSFISIQTCTLWTLALPQVFPFSCFFSLSPFRRFSSFPLL
uniref:Uncharacterized protein n=1 Tax=Rhizophora mucronata TaxID=61149 RepID=A0A2P2QN82_RHIMU